MNSENAKGKKGIDRHRDAAISMKVGSTDDADAIDETGHYYVGGIVAVGRKQRAQVVVGFEDYIRKKAALEERRSGKRIWVLARAATMDGLRMIQRNAFELVRGPSGLGGLFQRQF